MEIKKFRPEVEEHIIITVDKIYEACEKLDFTDYRTYLAQVSELISREILKTELTKTE